MSVAAALMSVSFTSSPLNAERVVCELSCEPARFLPPVTFERDFEACRRSSWLLKCPCLSSYRDYLSSALALDVSMAWEEELAALQGCELFERVSTAVAQEWRQTSCELHSYVDARWVLGPAM